MLPTHQIKNNFLFRTIHVIELLSSKSQPIFQCESVREWLLLSSGCLPELTPPKWPLLLPTVSKSKPKGTESPPSSTLRTYTKEKCFKLKQLVSPEKWGKTFNHMYQTLRKNNWNQEGKTRNL